MKDTQRGSQATCLCFDVSVALLWICLELLHVISVSSKALKHRVVVFVEFETGGPFLEN